MNRESIDKGMNLTSQEEEKVHSFKMQNLNQKETGHRQQSLMWASSSKIRKLGCHKQNGSTNKYICAIIQSEKLWPSDFLVNFHCSISSVSAYYWPESDNRVKSYCHLNLTCAATFNFERLHTLCAWIGHPSQKLLSFEFAQSFYIQFWDFRYITGLNRTSE